MSQSNVSEELLHLRKRARRRLVGAVALVVFALIVLWTVLDTAPPPRFASGQAVEIVSSAPGLTARRAASVVAVVEPGSPAFQRPPTDAAAMVPDAAASVASAVAAPVVTPPAVVASVASRAAVSPAVLPGKLVNRPPEPVKDAAPAKPKPAADPQKILEGQLDPTAPVAKPASKPVGKYFVQIGAFAEADKVQRLTSKLKSAGLPVLAEKVKTPKGVLTRIRIGPAADNAKAEAYRKKAESLGIAGKVIK